MTDKRNQEIILPKNTTLAVRSGNLRLTVEFNDELGATITTSLPVTVRDLEVSDQPLVRVPEIGESLKAGWKYAGISASTARPLWVSSEDAACKESWGTALRNAMTQRNYFGVNGSCNQEEAELMTSLVKGEHDNGLRIPTSLELQKNLLSQWKKIGGFRVDKKYELNEDALQYASPNPYFYWSSLAIHDQCDLYSIGQFLGERFQIKTHRSEAGIVRYVHS